MSGIILLWSKKYSNLAFRVKSREIKKHLLYTWILIRRIGVWFRESRWMKKKKNRFPLSGEVYSFAFGWKTEFHCHSNVPILKNKFSRSNFNTNGGDTFCVYKRVMIDERLPYLIFRKIKLLLENGCMKFNASFVIKTEKHYFSFFPKKTRHTLLHFSSNELQTFYEKLTHRK